MSDSARAKQVKDMIRNHLEVVGAAEWKAVRTQCPEISDATFWRYVKAVREEGNKGEAHEAATSPDPTADSDVPRLGALPAFYNPLQKARLYEALLADAEALRAHAVDRRGKITNARQFEKSILLRERLLSQQAEMMNFFQSQEATTLFFKEIIEITGDLPEAVVRKLMTRMHEEQERRLAATGPQWK
jgi:hypothetical protein